MAEHNELGRRGEELAVEYLLKNKYVIVERNWVFQKAEVDIIAAKENVLAIVEVKTRSTSDFGDPQEFVNQKKIKMLVKAADEYVNLKNLSTEIRFDIIAVSKDATNYKIEHLQDAFYYF